MASVLFACVVFLTAVLIPADTLNAAPDTQNAASDSPCIHRYFCVFCHMTEVPPEHNRNGTNCQSNPDRAKHSEFICSEDPFNEVTIIAATVQSYSSTPRFWFHGALEFFSVFVSIIGIVFTLWGAYYGIRYVRDIIKGHYPFPEDVIVEESDGHKAYMRFEKFHHLVLRGLGVLIVAEIIASVSVGSNPTAQRLWVLGVIVGVRCVLGYLWMMEGKRPKIIRRSG